MSPSFNPKLSSRILRLAIIAALFPSLASAQPHFSCISNTEDSYAIVIQSARVNDLPLAIGDEIAAFTPLGFCGGMVTVNDTSDILLAAWEDDSFTDDIDGFRAGDSIVFKIWDGSSEIELDPDALFIQGNGTFGSGPFSVVELTLEFNFPPRINLQSRYSFDEDTSLEIDLNANVIDENHAAASLDWSVSSGVNINASITPGNTLLFVPQPNWFGIESFELIAADPESASDTAVVEIEVAPVNDLPAVQLPANVTIMEDDSSRVLSLDSFVQDVEDSPDEINWQAESTTTDFAVRLDNALRTLQLLPAQDINGTRFVDLTATDTDMGSTTKRLTVNITPVQDRPVAAIPLAPIAGAIVADTADVRLVWQSSFDADGDEISYTAVFGTTQGLETPIDRLATQDTNAVIAANTLEADTRYFWRIESSDGVTLTVFSRTDSFRTAPDTTTSVTAREELPAHYALDQNYPNPFVAGDRVQHNSGLTVIRFALPAHARVSIAVYNSIGQQVNELVDKALPAGVHEIAWDGRHQNGYKLPSGQYWLRMQSESFEATRKMMIIR